MSTLRKFDNIITRKKKKSLMSTSVKTFSCLRAYFILEVCLNQDLYFIIGCIYLQFPSSLIYCVEETGLIVALLYINSMA